MAPSGSFRGDVAQQRGLVTRAMLAGPRFRRVFPNVYVPADAPLTLGVRSRAAYLLVLEHGALAGYSAADLLGARCAPADADAEVIIPGRNFRERPGLRVHRDRLADDEVTEIDGVLLTAAARTAYDLARWLPLSDAGAHSVMESRCRLVLVLRGLPPPRTQFPVAVPGLDWTIHLDLAYPEHRVGIEYDGAGHRSRAVMLSDNERHNLLLSAGWTVFRFTSDDVLRTPDAMALTVRRALHAGRR